MKMKKGILTNTCNNFTYNLQGVLGFLKTPNYFKLSLVKNSYSTPFEHLTLQN